MTGLKIENIKTTDIRAYRIADNKLTELDKWSIELLNLEFSELSNLDLDFNLEITGFETAEIDLMLDGDGASAPKADAWAL